VAKGAIPDPLERRHLVERPLAPDAALRLAEAYLAEDRPWDAIAFLQKAGASERLAALREEAVRAGDAFLARELSRALGEELDPARWRALAEAAGAAGKERYAAQARRLADRSEDSREDRSEGSRRDRTEG
jgi:hypothetical protein